MGMSNATTKATETTETTYAIEAQAMLASEGITVERDGEYLVAPWGTKFRANISRDLLSDRFPANLADRVRGSKRMHDAAKARKAG